VRRGTLPLLLGIGIVSAAITAAVAYLIPWLPAPASREAGRIVFVYWFAEWISIVVFAAVCAVLGTAIVKFRVKPGDLSDGPPIHGHTTLEVIWTAIPFVLVTAITIVSAIVLAKDGDAGSNPLKVKVTGQQFAWEFTYPNGKTYTSLHLPVDRKVQLSITSKDVIHSFWVPEMAQKQDAVPGQINTLVITPDKLGVYPVICTELCGLGHALMRSEAIVQTTTDYDTWYKGSPTTGVPAAPAGGSDPGLAVFNANGCAACHALAAAKATGAVGPSLDELKAEAAGAGQPLDDFIKDSIVDPDAYVEKTYQPHVMPATYKDTLSSDQLDQLVQYLATSSKDAQ
jgi:cytochrome c oxidase subunit 2